MRLLENVGRFCYSFALLSCAAHDLLNHTDSQLTCYYHFSRGLLLLIMAIVLIVLQSLSDWTAIFRLFLSFLKLVEQPV